MMGVGQGDAESVQATSFWSETLGFVPSLCRCRQAGGGGERWVRVRRTKKRPTWAASRWRGWACKREKKGPGRGRIQFDSRLCMQDGARL